MKCQSDRCLHGVVGQIEFICIPCLDRTVQEVELQLKLEFPRLYQLPISIQSVREQSFIDFPKCEGS